MSEEKVIILLSTYNAQKYLQEQLDSLLKQTYSNIEIVIRDDGSKDETLCILQEYSEKYSEITYYAGENKGAKESFFDLVEHVKDKEFCYCAFCDQDDYWLPEKIAAAVLAINELDKENTPVLYCGKTKLVDASLKPLNNQIKRDIHPAFSNALVENVVTGCTTVLNRKMYEIMVSYIPKYCIMHDWWMYLIGTCFGQVIYDEHPYILYRQHGNNVMGIDGSYATEMKNRAKKYQSRKSNICIQAEEFVRLVEKNEQNKEYQKSILKSDSKKKSSREKTKVSKKESLSDCYNRAWLLAHYKEKCSYRLSVALGHNVFRQRKMDHLIFKVLFLLGIR